MRSIIKEEIMHSDLVAMKDDRGNKITYKELEIESQSLFINIEERSLVFILCDHQMETVKFIYEILQINSVPLLLDAAVDQELIESLVGHYGPQYIYCKKICHLSENYCYKLEYEQHFLLETGNKRYKIHSDVALLLSTSGTTGSPKLVKLSYDNLFNNAKYVCKLMDIDKGQKGISPLSMGYVYGLNFYIWHWYCGATLLITEEPVFSNKFCEFYEKEKANNFAGIPYTYQMLKRIKFWSPEKLKYLHRAMSAGTQMSEKDQISLVSLMKEKFWILYGQTECTGVISGMNFEYDNIKLGSVGRVLENADAVINDKTKELEVKGNCICMGYANGIEKLSEGDVNQGILHTGDMATMDEEGCIYLKGRLTRYVKILGKRVSLDDVEEYLKNKFSDMDFACIDSEDTIVVYCSDMDGEKIYCDEIISLLDCKMQIPKKFVSCVKLEKLPRNIAGKVMYAELENLKYE